MRPEWNVIVRDGAQVAKARECRERTLFSNYRSRDIGPDGGSLGCRFGDEYWFVMDSDTDMFVFIFDVMEKYEVHYYVFFIVLHQNLLFQNIRF